MRIRLSSLAAIIALSCLCLAAEPTTYVVKKGDTLYGIARNFGVSVSALAAANGLTESKTLLEGKKLVIPLSGSGSSPSAPARTPAPSAASKPSPTPTPVKKPTEEYTIRQGDTLFGIARARGMDIDDLLRLNGLSRNSVIKAGKKLNVYAAPKASALPRPPAPGPSAGKKVASGVSWPVSGKMRYMDGLLHGVSITARKGDPVRAVANGTVVQASSYRGYSGVVFVERDNKMIYVYGGNDSLLVKKGDKVQAGAKLGYLGLDPKTGEPTMSFLVFQNGKALDPSTCPRD